MNDMLREARRLHDLGLSLIWLYSRAKNPKETGWTSGPRRSWEELEREYEPGDNVGVRLGETSVLASDRYLACIDVDVKDKSFKEKAHARLKSLLGGASYKDFPHVLSGSGNGSMHIYVTTSFPFPMVTVEKHRHQWEICIYSSGRQMVLPPSVHPSGQNYVWGSVQGQHKADFPFFDILPFLEKTSPPKERARETWANGLEGGGSEINVDEIPNLRPGMKDAIVRGDGVEDRSAFLLNACHALLSVGLTKEQVLSVLTNPANYLGECAYDHVGSSSRAKAERWILRYSLDRVMKERDASAIFEKEAIVENARVLGEEEAEAQGLEFDVKKVRFYTVGKKGALKPDYQALYDQLVEETPLIVLPDSREILTWSGTHYETVSPLVIKKYAQDHFRPIPDDKIRTEFLNHVYVSHHESREFFSESTKGLINFKNGILDLEGYRGLMEHTPDVGFRFTLPYDYDAEAECPEFKKWLKGVMLGDESLIRLVQEFMGYIVRGGDYQYHKALWLDGVGRNGKSTFIDVLKALIGFGNYSTISIKALVNDKFAGADLDGKIANFSEETSPQELADSGPFKNLTGDGEIFAQRKFGDPYSFRNRAKLIMSYNTIPDLKDLSYGMLSRPIIIPFRKKIEKEEIDTGVKQRLLAELSGIFNFALEGWERLSSRGHFTHSDVSANALEKVEQESCSVYQWIENYVTFDNTGEETRTQDLYTAYKGRERFPYNFTKFSRRLQAHPKMKKRYRRKETFRCYWGVKLE